MQINLNPSVNYCNHRYQSNIYFGRQKGYATKFRDLVEKSYNTQMKSFLNNSVIIDIPQMSNNTKLVRDIYPITEPHWILVRPQNKALSLVEIEDDKSLISDIEKIKTFLKSTYPEQDVVFFEHGSGTIMQNGEKFIQSAGKSVMFAHAHFCVLPKNVKGAYSKILEETKNILSQNNWGNIDAVTYKSSEILPNFKNIAKLNKIKKEEFPPYILISYIDNKTGMEESTVLLEPVGAKTPSQLLRKVVSEQVNDSKDDLTWDWRMYLAQLKK